MKRQIAVAIMLASIASCGDEGTQREGGVGEPGSAAQPTIDPSIDTFPEALANGRLEVDGDCILLVESSERALIVWPGGTTFLGSPPEVVELPDGTRLEIGGEPRRYGGGFVGSGAPSDRGYDLGSCNTDVLSADNDDDIWLMAAKQNP